MQVAPISATFTSVVCFNRYEAILKAKWETSSTACQMCKPTADGTHTVLLLDQAPWHVTPKPKVPYNITLPLRPRVRSN